MYIVCIGTLHETNSYSYRQKIVNKKIKSIIWDILLIRDHGCFAIKFNFNSLVIQIENFNIIIANK